MNFTDFTKDDFMGWAGALRWKNGDLPFILDTDNYTLIVGSEVGELYMADEEEGLVGPVLTFHTDEYHTSQEAKEAISHLANHLIADRTSEGVCMDSPGNVSIMDRIQELKKDPLLTKSESTLFFIIEKQQESIDKLREEISNHQWQVSQ